MDRSFETSARIVVLDDEPTNVRLMTSILESVGFEHVHGLTDPRLLMDLIDEWDPDLIVLDLQMPHIDGLTLLTEIRQREIPSEFVPIIVLTADDTHEVLIRAMEAGANDFLTKPFAVDEILIRIRNLIVIRASFKDLVLSNGELARRLVDRMKFSAFQHPSLDRGGHISNVVPLRPVVE